MEVKVLEFAQKMSVKQNLCGPCLEEKVKIVGVVYCKECEAPLCDQCKQDHARITALKRHKLCELEDVPPHEIQELLKNLIACPNHDNEEVVYLCKDHDTTCCNKCAMADHRKCEEVKVLSDFIHDIKMDCSGLKTVLHDLQQQGENLLEHERKHAQFVSEIESKALSSLKTVKQKLLAMYAQLENELLSAIADKKKVIGDKIKTNNENTCQLLNDIKQQSTYIEHIEKFGTKEHVVLLQRQLEKGAVCRLKLTVGELEKNRSKSCFNCVLYTSVDSLLLEIKNLLRIEDFTCDVSETGSETDNSHYKPYTERIPQLLSTKDLSILPMFDKAIFPDPRACIWIDKYIVLAFDTPNALLVIEEESDFVISKFKCDYMPWSVSKTGSIDMVITLPHAGEIAFAQLRYGNVNVLTQLKTRIPYYDVARNAPLNQYICMAWENGQIDILNNDGTLLRELSLDEDIKTCVAHASTSCNFNAYNLMLIISDFGQKKIIALNLNGDKVFEYTHTDLRGLGRSAVDPSGNVYVTCIGRNIHQISPSGQYVRSISLDKMTQIPSGICFNSTFDKLFICGSIKTKPSLQLHIFN